MCQLHGKITSTKAILDKNTNLCKGYGFVDFESPEAAEAAVKALQGQGIQAQMAKVREVKQQEQDPTNLYIANLPSFWSEQNLEQLFCQHGIVISTRILRDQQGQSRCVGFARMESREKCEQIIQKFNQKQVTGGTEPLLVKFADSGKKPKKNADMSSSSISTTDDEFQYSLNGYENGMNGNGSLANSMLSQMPAFPGRTAMTPGSYPYPGVFVPGTPYLFPPQMLPTAAQMMAAGYPGATDHVANLVNGMQHLNLAASAHNQQTVAGPTAGVPGQLQYVAASPYPMYGGTPYYHQPIDTSANGSINGHQGYHQEGGQEHNNHSYHYQPAPVTAK